MPNKPPHQTGVGLDHWGDQFPETRWSILIQKDDDVSVSPEDLEANFAALCTHYWYPLYAFVRKGGHASEDAQDLTQGFFAYLLSGDRMAKLDPAKGRFRSYLLGAMKHYLSDRRKYDRAEKRGGGKIPLSIETGLAESRFQQALSHDLSPEKLFDREWASTILTDTASQLEREFAEQGKANLFAEVGDYLYEKPPKGIYGEIAERLNMNEPNVRAIVSRMRKRYKAILRERIDATVDDASKVDDEIQELMSTFG